MSTYQVLLDGTAAGDDFYDAVSVLEVEENLHLPDALRLVLPVSAVDGDLSWVGDRKIRPYANIAVTATPEGGATQCVFDGYVQSHQIHLQAGITASTVEVRAQDASVLMGLEHKAREWTGMTEGAVANSIFGEYGFTPGARNTDDDTPAHDAPGHSLMQRGTDLEFLRRLARRSGRWCRVACAGAPGVRTGVFAVPDLRAEPVTTIAMNDPEQAPVAALDFHWDVARPNSVLAAQATLTDDDPEGFTADTTDSGLPLLDARSLAEFAGRTASVRLTTGGDAADLPVRARAVLREAGWFTGARGVADISRVRVVLRVGSVVALAGVGQLLSGRYLVTGVRHTIGRNSHTMAFTLARNAVGPAAGAAGTPGLPGGIG
ncbi:hypothetical protein Cs7R123_48340 [Catellatospora sp. TT07R-123]|uniref:phage late control D family protein n=1 Tax=Catellatospora sp. TT07R-123 TaxID=2733863 RepID=UPI001B29F2F6|nr:phage late control D family protein [Catellatospora sp. TT07R-123]GHJ47492.1 hypothetical protein Cs7R123_48340 [Catellatospora sp. TT07R-123]